MSHSESKTDPKHVRLSSAGKKIAGESQQPDFADWYDRFGDELLRFCQSRLGPNSGEDVFQQVWLKVLRKPEQFTGGNERAWLYQIARTSIIDHVRKKNPESQTETVSGSVDSRTESVLDHLVASEDHQQFRICLEKLPPEKQKLVHLRVTGYSYKQISQQLAIAIGTVGSQYNRTCEQLRNCVGESVR